MADEKKKNSLNQILEDATLKLDFKLPMCLFLHISGKCRAFEAFKNYLVTNVSDV